MRIKTLASGSSGNCTVIVSGSSVILIDAGISARRIEDGLKESGITPDRVSAILVTHEHIDHVAGLKVLLKHWQIPVYASRGTIRSYLHSAGPGVDPALFHEVSAEKPFQAGAFSVSAFPLSHDAAEPFAYRVFDGKKSAALMTDLGYYTDEHAAFLKGVNALILEANHDVRMLETGSYPYVLKRRILSDFGHLSNENAGQLLLKVLHPGLELCLLAHLSEENNLPELALLSVKTEIDLSGTGISSDTYKIETAPRGVPSPFYYI